MAVEREFLEENEVRVEPPDLTENLAGGKKCEVRIQ